MPSYDSTRTYVVQQTAGNVLVRGNIPLRGDGTFAYDELNDALGAILPAFDLTAYTLIDISLIDNVGELLWLQDEFTAFGAGPVPTAWPPFSQGVDIYKRYGTSVRGHPGFLMWNPFEGCADESNCSSVEPSLFDFPGIVDNLNTLMTTRSKTVIYYHCMNGHDRAGSLTACYMMKYMGRTRQEAMYDPPSEGAMAMGHDWHPGYGPLIEWYAGTIGKV